MRGVISIFIVLVMSGAAATCVQASPLGILGGSGYPSISAEPPAPPVLFDGGAGDALDDARVNPDLLPNGISGGVADLGAGPRTYYFITDMRARGQRGFQMAFGTATSAADIRVRSRISGPWGPWTRLGDGSSAQGLSATGKVSVGALSAASIASHHKFTTPNTKTLSFDTSETKGLAAVGGKPTDFHLPNVLLHTTDDPIGSRELVHAELRGHGGQHGSFQVGANFAAIANTGSGNYFGGNSYGIVRPGASSSTEISSWEFNIQAQREVARKSNIQVIELAQSPGTATGSVDSAIFIAKQDATAVGQRYGIQFGDVGKPDQLPSRSDGALLWSGDGTTGRGIDLSRTTFGRREAITLPVLNGGIHWYGHSPTHGGHSTDGGVIRSDVSAGGGAKIVFQDRSVISGQDSNGAARIEFDLLGQETKLPIGGRSHRLKLGLPNTGPGGVGRAVYVDD